MSIFNNQIHKKIKKLEYKFLLFLFKKWVFTPFVKVILLLFLVFFFSVLALYYILKPSVQKNINYGVNFSDKYATQLGLNWQESYLEILDELKVKNIRLVAYWDDIEPQNNQYDFSKIKWQVEQAQKRNVNVILAMGQKVPRYPECFTPTWWDNIKSPERKQKELYDYLERTIKELGTYSAIKMWQVENEPFFPFGECHKISLNQVKSEVSFVRSLDTRPVLIQDSGEGGLWFPTYKYADYLGISMYRRIWYDFWKILFGRFIYFKYPLAYWTYRLKAVFVGIPYEKIIVTELQAEPWGPAINSELSQREKDRTMSKHDFLTTLTYAQKAGFKDLYFWGVEWWLFEKNLKNNSYFWDTAKALMVN